MKRNWLIVFCGILLLPYVSLRADDDCDATLREAKTAYNAGDYVKAKKYYDYVIDACGGSYGNASSWSQKCQEALSPKLSVSRTNISVSAYSGTTSISVTSNRSWKLTNTSSSLYTVSRNGDNISISYSANPNTTSRSDYFDVVTTDGSKSVRVYISQEGKANTTPYLTVNKTSISASASGTTEYITVSSNTTWEIQYPSGTMYSVTRNGNTLTVKINANTSSESRNDYFNVKTTDGNKVQKITLTQSGKYSSSSSSYNSSSGTAEIADVRIEHNVMYNGQKCMKVHVNFVAHNVANHRVGVSLHFRDNNSGAQLKDYNGQYADSGGKVAHSDNAIASYKDTRWSDFVLYFPNSELHLTSGSNWSICMEVGIYDWTVSRWLTSSDAKKINFTYNPR